MAIRSYAMDPKPGDQSNAETVWMVHALTGMGGTRGHLAIEGDTLVFHPARGERGAEYFPLAQIRRVRRPWRSPVLEIQLDNPDGLQLVGFYFIKPPSLEAPEGTRFSFKRRARRRAVADLYRGGATKQEEITHWLDAIERARGDRGGREPGLG
jgi:hypothetical protein